MPIYIPGKRDPRRRNRLLPTKRTIIVGLSLTSMVDMFTIMVVFLLQNYSSTGEIIYIPKDVKLPKASQVKELKPAHIVMLTTTEVILDKETVATLDEVKNQKDWMIPKLKDRLVAALQTDVLNSKQALSQTVKNVIPGGLRPAATPVPDESKNKVTVQADREMDFLTIKKIMYTVTEAGASEINFAVVKKDELPLGTAVPAPTGNN
jgi:biopolymer transport protein ExbD